MRDKDQLNERISTAKRGRGTSDCRWGIWQEALQIHGVQEIVDRRRGECSPENRNKRTKTSDLLVKRGKWIGSRHA